jgi:hypothetical protein
MMIGQRRVGAGAPQASSIVISTAKDLDALYAVRGCDGCSDMGSQLRARTLAFKAACLLDPVIAPLVNLNMSTPIAQSGFGPGTDAALTLVLSGARQSSGHCTDDAGNCLTQGTVPLTLSPELNAIGDAIRGAIESFQKLPAVNKNDATIQAMLDRVVLFFRDLVEKFQARGGGGGETPSTLPQQQPSTLPQQQPPAPATAPHSLVPVVMAVAGVGILGIGVTALLMTYAKKKGAR